MNILCKIGLHKEECKTDTVYENESICVSNYYVKCSRCGKELDSYGVTTISFPPIEIKEEL